MKSTILISSIFLFISIGCYSQVQIKDTINVVNISYRFKYDLEGTYLEELVDGSPFKDNISGSSQKQIAQGYKIKALYKKDGYVYYRYWDFNASSALYQKYNNGKLFRMSESNFNMATQRLYSRYKGVKVGVYTVPFRLRGIGTKNFDFETALSLQSNIVFGFGKITNPESMFDISWGIGLTRVNLDSSNSNVTENRTASALTTSFGGVIKPSQYVNIGVFFGWDFLGKTDRQVQWIYNKKTWLGIGVNISFDAIKTDNTADGHNL